MNTLKLNRFIVVNIFILSVILISGFIRREFITTKYRPLFNVSLIAFMLLIVVIDTLLREKKGDMPNYKIMFFYSLALLFSYIVYMSFKQ